MAKATGPGTDDVPDGMEPDGGRLAGLVSRLEGLVGDAEVDVDAPIEDDAPPADARKPR